jgi:uncharacterized OsmC-like protein
VRNNFNTSAFSELKFEIYDDPAQAWFSYVGVARHTPRRGLTAWIGPAMLGTLKSARNFSYQLTDPLHEVTSHAIHCVDNELSPFDLALTGLGSCSLKTLIAGGSAKGITFESAEVNIELVGSPARGEESRNRLDCRFEIDAAMTEEMLTELLGQVQMYSPNHRTLTDRLPVTIEYRDRLSLFEDSGVDLHRRTFQGGIAERSVGWITGPQFESWAIGRRETTSIPVDSPKQLTGADWGPNAQEFLLLGLAADVASNLNDHAVRDLGISLPWEVTASGAVDLGGLLGTRESRVGLQDTRCVVRCLSEDEGSFDDRIREVVEKAAHSSIVCALIAQPQEVTMSLKSAHSDTVRRIGRRAY